MAEDWLIFHIPTIVLFWGGILTALAVSAVVIERKDRNDLR